MEKITINKGKLLATYREANEDQQVILEFLYGKETFQSDWREITSYEKACEVLGIEPIEFKEVGDRPQYMRMANAMQKILVICEAINGDCGWYDKDCLGYFPTFVLYSKHEMDELGESEVKRKCIHHILTAYNVNYADGAGVRYTNTNLRSVFATTYHGFPLCLNSEEKSEFVGKQFFELCCACYGLTIKMDDEQ